MNLQQFTFWQVRDWTSRFHQILKLNVRELTGDMDNSDRGGMESADIICATPEKFGECYVYSHPVYLLGLFLRIDSLITIRLEVGCQSNAVITSTYCNS